MKSFPLRSGSWTQNFHFDGEQMLLEQSCELLWTASLSMGIRRSTRAARSSLLSSSEKAARLVSHFSSQCYQPRRTTPTSFRHLSRKRSTLPFLPATLLEAFCKPAAMARLTRSQYRRVLRPARRFESNRHSSSNNNSQQQWWARPLIHSHS